MVARWLEKHQDRRLQVLLHSLIHLLRHHAAMAAVRAAVAWVAVAVAVAAALAWGRSPRCVQRLPVTDTKPLFYFYGARGRDNHGSSPAQIVTKSLSSVR